MREGHRGRAGVCSTAKVGLTAAHARFGHASTRVQERQQKKPSAGAGMTTPIASPAGLRRVREPSVKGRPSPESAAQMQRAPASKKGRSASTYCRVRDSAHVDGHALTFDSAAAPDPSSAHSNACPCLCVARCRRWRGRRRRDGWRRGGARSGQRGGRRHGRRAERRGGRRRHRQRGRQQSRHEAYQARGHGLARPSSSSVPRLLGRRRSSARRPRTARGPAG